MQLSDHRGFNIAGQMSSFLITAAFSGLLLLTGVGLVLVQQLFGRKCGLVYSLYQHQQDRIVKSNLFPINGGFALP